MDKVWLAADSVFLLQHGRGSDQVSGLQQHEPRHLVVPRRHGVRLVYLLLELDVLVRGVLALVVADDAALLAGVRGPQLVQDVLQLLPGLLLTILQWGEG